MPRKKKISLEGIEELRPPNTSTDVWLYSFCHNWRIDLDDHISSRINPSIATDCRTFRACRPSSTVYVEISCYYFFYWRKFNWIHNGHTCALPYMDKTDMHIYLYRICRVKWIYTKEVRYILYKNRVMPQKYAVIDYWFCYKCMCSSRSIPQLSLRSHEPLQYHILWPC